MAHCSKCRVALPDDDAGDMLCDGCFAFVFADEIASERGSVLDIDALAEEEKRSDVSCSGMVPEPGLPP